MKIVTGGWCYNGEHHTPASRRELDVPKEGPSAVLSDIVNNFWRARWLERWCLGPVSVPSVQRVTDCLQVIAAEVSECTAEL